MTIPNLITALRIILTPILIIYLIEEQFKLALFCFAIAAISDGLDGFLARKINQKSPLGTYLDPIADKFLLVTSFVTLSIKEIIPPWLTVLAISRDILILLGVLILFLSGIHLNVNPSRLSKINTCLQFTVILIALSKDIMIGSFFSSSYTYLCYVTGIFTISSGLHYMHYWFKVISENGAKQSS